jgi:hypothetical protein
MSGYHMALVAGVVFFLVRAGLALSPGLALRRPIKKWAAAAALVAAAGYLVLSAPRSRRSAPSSSALVESGDPLNFIDFFVSSICYDAIFETA